MKQVENTVVFGEEQSMESSHQESSIRGSMPLYVKIIILVQAAVILTFTVGMYQEYLNNSYLQEYAVGVFKSSLVAEAMLSMVTISMFAIGTFTIMGSMSAKRLGREWKSLSRAESETFQMPAMPIPPPFETVRTPRRAARPRKRRPRLDTEDLYRSMVGYADHRDWQN
ncbi:hypothetical protein J2P12_01360 [Candidatus Bathyarchaeota archaeon]|nr:hypothetical protein [Candidatus Bathyarchaeota archaeon]